MEKISFAAQYVITNTSEPIKNGVVSVDVSTGEILEIKQLTNEIPYTEFYNGVLIPGFVNAHCHLELCHLKDKVKNPKSLIDFLLAMFRLDANSYDEKLTLKYDSLMYSSGVSAVGDICNTSDTAGVKEKSKIHYKNFVELIGTTPERCQKDILQFENVKNDYLSLGIDANDISAVPHAPYSVSPELFSVINRLNKDKKEIISIHNQENFNENFLYENHSGEFVEKFPLDLSLIPVTGKTSLKSMKELCEGGYERTLLVHNIYSSKEDLDFAAENFKNPFFVVCPKSNIFLENKIIDVNVLLEKNLTVCIGTDSLSSNDNLSMIEELKLLSKKFENLKLEDLIKFATLNGAKALGLQSKLGSFEIGKSPGVVLLENVDLHNFRLTDNTLSRRLI